ncbi:thermonuclease family protein [Metabacillus idriensis]|uniref:thermonuclease family protein n=1 Tax=Metabacillus idriensis TaxID=324768 RepID=UPI002813DDF4|nr:thermonuclease family protein [Metabacillus idriensis]MDR0137021.1 thermonuclease family protein [Metabacillus idriensis]
MKKWLLLLITACMLTACSETTMDETPAETEKENSALQEDRPTPSEGEKEKSALQEKEEAAPPESEKEAAAENEHFIPAKVVRVIDGDTVKVLVEGKEETLRLLLVDTPETVHPNKPVQPFGPEASSFAKSALAGKEVELELDVGERDKYGRLLVYLHVDGKMFNKLLIEKGLARVGYVYAPNTKHVDEFYELQKAARKKEIGIWSIENYATEDEGFNGGEEKAEAPKEEPAGACTIKGNISSSGDKIYHMPEGQYYDVTKEEEMFCSEEEAAGAGYRASKR